jgi:hypothetical protein
MRLDSGIEDFLHKAVNLRENKPLASLELGLVEPVLKVKRSENSPFPS